MDKYFCEQCKYGTNRLDYYQYYITTYIMNRDIYTVYGLYITNRSVINVVLKYTCLIIG